MKDKKFIVAVAAAFVVLAAIYFIFTGGNNSTGLPDGSADRPGAIAEKIKRLREGDTGVIREFVKDETARKNLREIADLYEKELRFPMYSRPISANNHDLLNPHEFIAVERPFPDNDKLSYDLALPRQVMFHGEPIIARLRITSKKEPVPNVTSVKGRLIDDDKGFKVITEFELKQAESSDKIRTFTADYTPLSTAQWSNHITLAVAFQPEGYREMTAAAQFTYADPVAKVTGTGNVRVDGAHLVIPVNLDTKKSTGDYMVTGNLHAAGSDKPLINAFGVSAISGSSGTVEIKIHAAALREKGDPGPYVLKTITVERLPTTKDSMLYGTGQDKVFTIPRHELNEYSDEKYENQEEVKKLQLLKNFLNE